jgi:cell division protein FtsB
MKKGGRWLIVAAVAVVVVVLFLAGPNGLVKLIKMKQQESQLEKRMVQLQAEIEITKQRIDRLATDPDYLRLVAKQHLMMIDPMDSAYQDTIKQDSLNMDSSNVQSVPADSVAGDST